MMKVKATGIANKTSTGKFLDVYFPNIESNNFAIGSQVPEISNHLQEIVEVDWCESELQEDVSSPIDAYLKLHLLSNKFVLPNTINLNGLFGVLPNIAWTNQGPIDIDEINERLHKAKVNKNDLYIKSVDKFPCMTDYVVPKNVRIADASRVRLGAYLSEGTTVMHEGFVNFNSGTEGPGMIEGRISAGVKIGAGSDLGGGCSTMGTLSGGGDTVISVGKKCLIGANAGIGIPLGDRCTIEAGLYVTSGTKVTLIKANGSNGDTVKARSLANVSDLLFRRNSQSGGVECLTNQSEVELNADLHSN